MQTLTQAAIFEGQSAQMYMDSNSTGISETEFEQVFKSHFKALHAYACTILQEEAMAEEIVQQVFFKLWEKRDQVNIQQSLNAYLYRSVYNECLNYLKHKKVRKAHQSHTLYTAGTASDQVSRKVIARELEEKIADALNQLPEQCRTIFQMSRFEELKYREIADKLNLSVKTVENQMGKALKIMRMQLVEYLPVLLPLITGITIMIKNII
ncbi:RNA polymerase sigma-70 factor [Taibaiella koreensis]|uniref:RNA polymerase sigma-70 factor n=1 Tax=Taibaiella koreensis TaxID=1268548 RepID=UPI00196974ED|nr:RNA polymerase sigma-70 factor [Taibaiella koreensis]